MKAAAIVIALGIALIVTMGPAPASAQTTVVRECGDDYVVTRYNQDGSVKGVHNKQLSAQGTIYTGGKTWLLVEGTEGNPDRFVSDGEVLQVSPCDATLGVEVRQFQPQVPGTQRQVQGTQTSTTLVSNLGQAVDGNNNIDTQVDNAQSFTTGSNELGYRLTRVDLRGTRSASGPTNFTMSIHTDSSGKPGSKLGTLPTPAPPSTWGTMQFAAPGEGIILAKETTYWVVLDATATPPPRSFLRTTSADGDDAGAAPGWSMGNEHRWRLHPETEWGTKTLSNSILIAIVGEVLTRHSQLPETQYSHHSPNRSTLYDHYVSQCTHMRSVSDPYRDYSLFNADGRRIQARNGWKWVEVQNAAGDVTGTRPMTISECASNGLYHRQAFCSSEDLKARNGHIWDDICPDVRTW